MNGAFDLNTLLQILQLVVVVLGAFKFLGDMNKNIAVLTAQRESEAKVNAEKFDKIEQQLKQLNETTVKIAAQEARLDAVDVRVNDLLERLDAIREQKVKLLAPPRQRKRN